MGDTRCKHCGERIIRSTFVEWWHEATRQRQCGLYATPEEARRG